MPLFFIPLLLLSGLSAIAQTSYVPPNKILGKKGYQLGFSMDFWNSRQGVDLHGNDNVYEAGEFFKRTQAEASGLYGLTENFQVGLGLRYRNNESRIYQAPDFNTETSSGVESTFFSGTYAFKAVDQWQWSIDGLFRYRPYTNRDNSDGTNSLILGDEGNEFSLGLGLTYFSKTNNYLTFRGGYRDPGSEISKEFYYQAEGALSWKYLALIAGVDGAATMANDPSEQDLANRPNFYTGRGGLYHAYNRQWIAPYAGVNLSFGEHWRAEFRASTISSARSYDLGSSYSLALYRRVDTYNKTIVDRKFKNYDIEAAITKVSPKKGYVVIDKGLSSEVRKGQRIDFYENDYVGGNILIATGIVMQSKVDSAIVKVTHLYNTKRELKEGIIARGNFR